MFVAIGITATLVPVPVSYDRLIIMDTLDAVRPDRIIGDFYPQESFPEWYIKFSVIVEDKHIVSKSKLVLAHENHTYCTVNSTILQYKVDKLPHP